MNDKQINELKALIESEEKYYNFNDFVFNYIDIEELKEIDNIEDLEEYLRDLNDERQITDTEVIYYSNAIEYLKENDNSLNNSLELARGLGYTIENINSEKLASLLKSDINLNDYGDFINTIIGELKDIFEEVENEN